MLAKYFTESELKKMAELGPELVKRFESRLTTNERLITYYRNQARKYRYLYESVKEDK